MKIPSSGRRLAFALMLLAWLATGLEAMAQPPCLPRLAAPGKFNNTPSSWGNNSGPILTGFLDLKGASGLFNIEHGVDLSHHNVGVRYDELKACGATFAIVKMDRRFQEHHQKLTSLGLDVIPYHYLSVKDGATDYRVQQRQFADTSDAETAISRQQPLLEIARRMGKEKAESFIIKYRLAFGGELPTVDLAGMHGQIIALDVEETLAKPSTKPQQKNFGRFYAAMLSSWIGRVRESYPGSIIIFYTFPDVYLSYLQFALPDDHAIIHGLPIWLARTRRDAGDLDLKVDKGIQRICLSSSGGNRCILHQYSHRAIFAIDNRRQSTPPPSLDVNRLFLVKQVEDKKGVQYVRHDD